MSFIDFFQVPGELCLYQRQYISNTIKPVLRGNLWDKEKVAL